MKTVNKTLAENKVWTNAPRLCLSDSEQRQVIKDAGAPRHALQPGFPTAEGKPAPYGKDKDKSTVQNLVGKA